MLALTSSCSILFFYICGVIVIGMLVSPQDDRLVQSGKSKGTASASPFVLAIQSVQIQVSSVGPFEAGLMFI